MANLVPTWANLCRKWGAKSIENRLKIDAKIDIFFDGFLKGFGGGWDQKSTRNGGRNGCENDEKNKWMKNVEKVKHFEKP